MEQTGISEIRLERESSLAYLEKHLQGIERSTSLPRTIPVCLFLCQSLCFQNMWFQEIKDLTETVAQDLLRGVMKILLMPSDLSGTCEETAFLLSRMVSRLSARFRLLEGFFHASCKWPLKRIP